MTVGRLIKNISPKLPEIGRLRAGEKGKKGEPVRIDKWRFTTKDAVVAEAFAARYGGSVAPWADHPGEHEVYSDVDEIEIFLPPDPLMSAYERWGSGGCKRRCDGEMCDVPIMDGEGGRLEEQDCECALQGWTPGHAPDVKKGACTIAVRLRVIDPFAPGMGIYLMTSSSKIAAAELPAQVGLMMQMAERGVYIPARLVIEPREEKKPWEKYRREYNVPALRPRRSMAELAELDSRVAVQELAGSPAALAGTRAALPAGNGSGGGDAGRSEPSVAPVETSPPPASRSTSGKANPGLQRAVASAAKRADVDGPELTALLRHAAKVESLDQLDPAGANAMLAALKEVGKGLHLRYDANGAPSWTDGEVVQGELVKDGDAS